MTTKSKNSSPNAKYVKFLREHGYKPVKRIQNQVYFNNDMQIKFVGGVTKDGQPIVKGDEIQIKQLLLDHFPSATVQSVYYDGTELFIHLTERQLPIKTRINGSPGY